MSKFDVTRVRRTSENGNGVTQTSTPTPQKTNQPTIFVGMTLKQATEAGADTLALFNKYNTNDSSETTIDETEFAQYKQTNGDNSSVEVETQPPERLIRTEKEIKTRSSSLRMAKMHNPNANAIDVNAGEYVTHLGVIAGDILRARGEQIKDHEFWERSWERTKSNTALEAAINHDGEQQNNPEEIDPSNITKMYLDALDENNEESLYSLHYERIKNGDWTDYEKENFPPFETLTDEEIKELAKYSVETEFIKKFNEAREKATNDGNEELAKQLIKEVQELNNEGLLLGILPAFVTATVSEIQDETIQKEIANEIGSNINNLLGDDDELNKMLIEVIMLTASEDTVENMIANNTEFADLFKDASENLLNTLKTTEETSSLKQTIQRGLEKLEVNIQTNNRSNDTNTSTTSSYQNKIVTTNGYSSNPITKLKEASQQYYNEILSPTQNKDNIVTPELNIATHAFRNTVFALKQDTTPQRRTELKQEITTHFDTLIKNINNIEETDKIFVKNFLNSAMPDVLFTLYLNGSSEVRDFMDKGAYIKQNELFLYLERNPVDIKKASSDILEAFEEYKREKTTELS